MTILSIWFGLFVILQRISPSLSSSSSSSEIPKWLSHVDDDLLQKHIKSAKESHVEAVKTALDHYPTDDVLLPPGALEHNRDLLMKLKFNKFRIVASGSLPDYHDELGDAPVFVTRPETPLFTKEECQNVIDMAESSFEGQAWPKLPSGQYYIQGFWIKDVPTVRKWFTEMCRARLFPLLQQQFPDFVDDIEDLVVDQAYLFKYIPKPGLRTEIHTDAGCLSFTFALNSKDEYEGGGTWVEGLESIDGTYDGDIIEMDVGQCTVRPGGIRHAGIPLTKGTRYIIGGFCMNRKRVETVRQLLESDKDGLEAAIKLNPQFDGAYPSVAHHYENEGDVDKSIQVLRDCLRLANPRSTTASYYLGTTYYKQGEFEKARQCMMTCLEVDSNDGDAMQTLAQIFEKLGKPEEERNMYQKIVSTPGVSTRILSNAYCNLGNLHEGKIETEMEYYQKSLDFEDTNVAALQSLGSVYASKQDWKNAIDCYRKAVESPSGGDDEEVLSLLYRVATRQLQSENSSASEQQSREAMMERLGQIMGKSNLERLMALKAR